MGFSGWPPWEAGCPQRWTFALLTFCLIEPAHFRFLFANWKVFLCVSTEDTVLGVLCMTMKESLEQWLWHYQTRKLSFCPAICAWYSSLSMSSPRSPTWHAKYCPPLFHDVLPSGSPAPQCSNSALSLPPHSSSSLSPSFFKPRRGRRKRKSRGKEVDRDGLSPTKILLLEVTVSFGLMDCLPHPYLWAFKYCYSFTPCPSLFKWPFHNHLFSSKELVGVKHVSLCTNWLWVSVVRQQVLLGASSGEELLKCHWSFRIPSPYGGSKAEIYSVAHKSHCLWNPLAPASDIALAGTETYEWVRFHATLELPNLILI